MYKYKADFKDGYMDMTKQSKVRMKISGAGCVLALIGFAAALFFDQFTKYMAVLKLKDQAPFVVINGVFELRYLENRGAAFGMMQDMRFILAAGAVLVCGVIVYFICVRLKSGDIFLFGYARCFYAPEQWEI